MLTVADLDAFRSQLLDLRAALQNSSSSTALSRQTVALDQQAIGRLSRMDALQNQAIAVADESRRRKMVTNIEKALARIESDEFGLCLECDEPIPLGRLKLDPTIATCVTCASGG